MVEASGRVLRIWRATVCAVVALDVVVAAIKVHVRTVVDAAAPTGPERLLDGALAVLTVTALIGLFSYAKAGASFRIGLSTFALVRAVFFLYEWTHPTGHEDLVQGGSAFLGWLVGDGLALAARAPTVEDDAHARARERLAATTMLAALATTYLSAGLSKLVDSGATWMETDTLRLMVLSHYEYGMNSWLDPLRQWLGDSPRFCAALSVGTLVVQLGALALLGPPRLRSAWAWALAAFHAGIWLASRILFVQTLVLLFVIAVPWDALFRTVDEATEPVGQALDPIRLGRTVLGCLVVAAPLIGLSRLLGLGAS